MLINQEVMIKDQIIQRRWFFHGIIKLILVVEFPIAPFIEKSVTHIGFNYLQKEDLR